MGSTVAESEFCRSFLSTLEKRPIKLSSNAVSDIRKLEPDVNYALPKYPNARPKAKRPDPATSAQAAGASYTVKLTYSKAQNCNLEATVPTSMTILEIKERYSQSLHNRFPHDQIVPVGSIKLLLAKKPMGNFQKLDEMPLPPLGPKESETSRVIDLSVMLMGKIEPGGKNAAAAPAPTAPSPESIAPPVAVGLSGKEVLSTEEFWHDLQGFLVQRIKDEGEGARLVGLLKKAVQNSS